MIRVSGIDLADGYWWDLSQSAPHEAGLVVLELWTRDEDKGSQYHDAIDALVRISGLTRVQIVDRLWAKGGLPSLDLWRKRVAVARLDRKLVEGLEQGAGRSKGETMLRDYDKGPEKWGTAEAPDKPANRQIEVRLDHDDNLDEVVASEGALSVHLEQLDDNHWCLNVRQGRQAVRVLLWAKDARVRGEWNQDGEKNCQVIRPSAHRESIGEAPAKPANRHVEEL